MDKTCPCCLRVITPRRSVPNQRYCGQPECQRARKRAWRKEKRAQDGDYRETKKASQQRWQEKHPGYWREYREKHPEYTERNRQLQRERNRYKRRVEPPGRLGTGQVRDASPFAKIAKGDALSPLPRPIPGRYRLVPVGENIAKGDELIVLLEPVSWGTG